MQGFLSSLCNSKAGRVALVTLAGTTIAVAAEFGGSISGGTPTNKASVATPDWRTKVSSTPVEELRTASEPVEVMPSASETAVVEELDPDVQLVQDETGLAGSTAEITAAILGVRRDLTKHVLDRFSSAEEQIAVADSAAAEIKAILKPKTIDSLRASGASQSEINRAWAFIADGVDSNLGAGKYRF
jgi:hypothetical protein